MTNMFSSNGADRDSAASLYAADGSRKYLNASERHRVLQALASLNPDQALFAATLVWSGARISEVLALRPASFQLERGLVAIETLKRRRHSVREIPLPPQLLASLSLAYDLEAAQRDPARTLQRLWPWHRVTAWRYVKRLMNEADLIGKLACPRGLRHGFGVSTLHAGVPLNLLQRWLGHAQLRTTAIYADVSGPEERAFATKFWASAGGPDTTGV